MNQPLRDLYESHHAVNRPAGFSILEEERSALLKGRIGTGKSVLDIGCRDGTLTRHFAEGNTVTGADIDSKSLDKAMKALGIRTILMDLNGPWDELGEEKFDVIVAGEIIEHLYHPERVFERVSAHLAPGGVFIGSVPNAFSLKHRLRYLKGSKRYTPLSDPTHINQFSYGELKEMLERHFTNVEVIGLGRYERLAKAYPPLFAFDLFFSAERCDGESVGNRKK